MAKQQIIVLGAGVVGLSTARRLLRSGRAVTVLEMATPGGQGSRAAAGVAIPSVRLLDDPAMAEFTTAGRAVLADDLASLPEPQSLRRGKGVIRIVPDAKAKEDMAARAGSAPSWFGAYIDREELVRLEPAMEGTPLLGGYLNEDAFMVDTDGYLSALARDVQQRGGVLRTGVGAVEISARADGVQVRTHAGELKADALVLAAGAWSGQLPGLPALPIFPLRGQMMLIERPGAALTRVISGPSYLAPWRAGAVVVGATEEEAGFVAVNTPAGLLHLSATVAKLAPLYRDAKVLHMWAGLRAATKSGRPLIGALPDVPNVFVGAGHGGQGILTGAYTGQLLAQLITEGSAPAAATFAPGKSA